MPSYRKEKTLKRPEEEAQDQGEENAGEGLALLELGKPILAYHQVCTRSSPLLFRDQVELQLCPTQTQFPRAQLLQVA